jgi:integrase
MYLTAGMSGLRQGELIGLRWRDLDWPAARVRVRQSYVRGEFTSPKSRRGTRSVPLETTLIYADYSPSEQEREWVEAAFARGRLVPPAVPRAELPGSSTNDESPV